MPDYASLVSSFEDTMASTLLCHLMILTDTIWKKCPSSCQPKSLYQLPMHTNGGGIDADFYSTVKLRLDFEMSEKCSLNGDVEGFLRFLADGPVQRFHPMYIRGYLDPT